MSSSPAICTEGMDPSSSLDRVMVLLGMTGKVDFGATLSSGSKSSWKPATMGFEPGTSASLYRDKEVSEQGKTLGKIWKVSVTHHDGVKGWHEKGQTSHDLKNQIYVIATSIHNFCYQPIHSAIALTLLMLLMWKTHDFCTIVFAAQKK